MVGWSDNVAPTSTPSARRRAVTLAVRTSVAVGFALAAGNASATALEGMATALRLLTPLVLLAVLKGHQSQHFAGDLMALCAAAGLALGATSLWRSRAALASHLRLASRWRTAASPLSSFDDAAVVLPAHVDPDRLNDELRQHFFQMQSAWDRSERAALSQLTTPSMLDELCLARAAEAGIPQRMEVLKLELRVLAFEAVGGAEIVYVEFCGTIRESAPPAKVPFQELWMLTRRPDTAGTTSWRLARHQALL